MGGRLTHLEELALPFQQALIDDLERLGYANKDTDTVAREYPNLPPFPRDRGPTNSVGVEHLLVGFGAYVGLRLTDGLISNLADDLYDKVVKAAFNRLRDAIRSRPDAPTVTAVIEHWFDGQAALVRVLVYDATATHVHKHVPAALRFAKAHLEGSGSGPVVVHLRSAQRQARPQPRRHRATATAARAGVARASARSRPSQLQSQSQRGPQLRRGGPRGNDDGL